MRTKDPGRRSGHRFAGDCRSGCRAPLVLGGIRRRQAVQLTGVVTKVEWQNPHTFFYLDITDERTKKVTNWAFEMAAPTD